MLRHSDSVVVVKTRLHYSNDSMTADFKLCSIIIGRIHILSSIKIKVCWTPSPICYALDPYPRP